MTMMRLSAWFCIYDHIRYVPYASCDRLSFSCFSSFDIVSQPKLAFHQSLLKSGMLTNKSPSFGFVNNLCLQKELVS